MLRGLSETVASSVGGRFGRGGAPEFLQVVRQADELPYGFPLAESSHRELAEAAGLFDLTAAWVDRKTGGSTGSFRFLSVARPCLVRSVRARRGFGVSDFGMRPRGTGGSSA